MNFKFTSMVTTLILFGVCNVASAFTISMNADKGVVGEKAESSNCQKAGEPVFNTAAGRTFYTADESYSGGKSFELNIAQGSQGFGDFGGILDFATCSQAGGRKLVKGEEIWVRLRLKFPNGFEFNKNGRNKFLRLRTFHGDRISEGYNDLYIDATPGTDNWDGGYAPYQFIFEGAQQWYRAGKAEDFFQLGKWNTIEYQIRLDDKKKSQGGNSLVRIWYNGKLVGETTERQTLQRPDSYVESLYLFTYWDNNGAHKSQKLYVDDLVVTSDKPSSRDANGNPFIGVGNGSQVSQPSNVPASPPVAPNLTAQATP